MRCGTSCATRWFPTIRQHIAQLNCRSPHCTKPYDKQSMWVLIGCTHPGTHPHALLVDAAPLAHTVPGRRLAGGGHIAATTDWHHLYLHDM